jgi:hypothetical protein
MFSFLGYSVSAQQQYVVCLLQLTNSFFSKLQCLCYLTMTEMADESNDRREMKRGTIPTAALPKNNLIIYDPSPQPKTARTMGQWGTTMRRRIGTACRVEMGSNRTGMMGLEGTKYKGTTTKGQGRDEPDNNETTGMRMRMGWQQWWEAGRNQRKEGKNHHDTKKGHQVESGMGRVGTMKRTEGERAQEMSRMSLGP